MTSAVLGVVPGAQWTGYVLRRGPHLLGGGTWGNPSAIEHDARRGPVPLPDSETVAELLSKLDGMLATFHAANTTRVAVQTPALAARAGRTARALHAAPAAAMLVGAIAGHYGADRTVLVPASAGSDGSLPAELSTATSARAAGIGTLGRRGDVGPVRAAWYTSLRVGTVETPPRPAGLPSRPVIPAPGRPAPPVEPAADRKTVHAYQRALIAAVRARSPHRDEELLHAAAAAVAEIPRPAGAPAWTGLDIAAWIAAGAMTDGLTRRDRERLAPIWVAMEARTRR